MTKSCAYLLVLAGTLACSGSNSSGIRADAPPRRDEPETKAEARGERDVPAGAERPKSVIPVSEGGNSGGEATKASTPGATSEGSRSGGESSGGNEVKSDDAERPREPAAAPVTETLEFDGVRWASPVVRPPSLATAGNGRTFGVDEIFWGSGHPVVLDVIHHAKGELEALVEASEAAFDSATEQESSGEAEADGDWLTSHAALRTVRAGEPLTVVTTAGTSPALVGAFTAEGGASNGHLYVKLAPPVTSGKQALALRGAVAPDARLREPKAAKPGSFIKAQLRRVRALVSAEGRGRRLESSVTSIRASVPGSQVLTVGIPRKDEDDDYEGLSGLLVVEPSGTTHALVEPAERSHRVDVLYLVDLDGDGVDEVLFRSDYLESSGYVYLAVWNGSGYVNLQLSGDGG